MLLLAWRNIQFRKMRAALTTLGIASSILLVVTLSSILRLTEDNLVESFGRLGGQIRVQPQSSAMDGQSTEIVPSGIFMNPEDVQKVMEEATGYVEADSSPVVYQMIVPPVGPNMPPRMVLNGVVPGHEGAALAGLEMEQGSGLLEADRDVILGAGAHQYLSDEAGRVLKAGDQVHIPGAGQFTIKGIAKKSDPYSDALCVLPLATAQSALKRGDTVNYVVLTYKVDEVREVAEGLKSRLTDFGVITADAMLDAADQALSGQRTFFGIVNTTVYLTSALILFMVMYTSVMERTREIGTIRAVGAPRFSVVGAILIEAAIFTLLGAVLGSIGAYFVMGDWVDTTMMSHMLASGVKATAVALGIALLSALYPAVRAALINPLEALRYE